jgi:hypothetical protein
MIKIVIEHTGNVSIAKGMYLAIGLWQKGGTFGSIKLRCLLQESNFDYPPTKFRDEEI